MPEGPGTTRTRLQGLEARDRCARDLPAGGSSDRGRDREPRSDGALRFRNRTDSAPPEKTTGGARELSIRPQPWLQPGRGSFLPGHARPRGKRRARIRRGSLPRGSRLERRGSETFSGLLPGTGARAKERQSPFFAKLSPREISQLAT